MSKAFGCRRSGALRIVRSVSENSRIRRARPAKSPSLETTQNPSSRRECSRPVASMIIELSVAFSPTV